MMPCCALPPRHIYFHACVLLPIISCLCRAAARRVLPDDAAMPRAVRDMLFDAAMLLRR